MIMVPCKGVDVTLETRARMKQQLMTDTAEDPVAMLLYFRHLVTCIADEATVGREIVDAGCLPKFMNFLHKDHLELQEHAAWVLGNIAAGWDAHSQAVAEAGAVAPMVGLLRSDDLSVQKVAAQSLANIAATTYGRDKILADDFLTPLQSLLGMDEIPKGASSLLRNLCMGQNPRPRLSCLRPCLPTLARLVLHGSEVVADDACYGLVSLLRIHGGCLRPSLDASFLTEFQNHYKTNPDRRAFNTLTNALKQAGLTPPLPSQDERYNGSTKGTSPQSNSTPKSPQSNSTPKSPQSNSTPKSPQSNSTPKSPQSNSTPKSPQSNSTPKSPQSNSTPKSPQSNSTPKSPPCNSVTLAASRVLGRRRPRSPSPVGVCTRSTPKRARMSYSAGVYISPTKPRTRAFTKRFSNIALSHSASHTPQKKEELFRAVEEGELDRVQELVRHVGPSVTRGRKEYTLLHVAAENNRPHVTLFLLQLISPNVVSHDGHTPGHLAAMKGHTEALHILLSDPHMNPGKRDPTGNTYTHWLVGHLFEAVLNEDVGRVRSLLRVGADADQHAVRDATGWLARELQITSVRHLARVLRHDSILRVFDADRRTRNFKSEPCTATHHATAFPSPPHKKIQPSPVEVRGPDVYRMDSAPRGYVCLLSYGSFQDRPDLHLEGSQTDAHHLASVFSRMGYSGHAHFSLTADQTRHQLAKVRDMEVLARAGCAVFVISSHGEPRRQFLTSDMHTLDVQWVMDFFKDSQCPHLRNKPKLFIWDLCRGHQEGESGRGNTSGQLCGRVDEPLRDAVCLDSSSGGFTWHAFSEEGTPFIGALCTTLARHGPTKELAELYREFLKEYATAAPDAVPQLTNYGLNKRFYF